MKLGKFSNYDEDSYVASIQTQMRNMFGSSLGCSALWLGGRDFGDMANGVRFDFLPDSCIKISKFNQHKGTSSSLLCDMQGSQFAAKTYPNIDNYLHNGNSFSHGKGNGNELCFFIPNNDEVVCQMISSKSEVTICLGTNNFDVALDRLDENIPQISQVIDRISANSDIELQFKPEFEQSEDMCE